jgi:hypothetical protein
MPRDLPGAHNPRGRFPRPNLTLRELIGLVVAFAVSNAFLARFNPPAAHHVFLFAFWNGALGLYLGFAFLQAWVRSILRWIRTGDATPPGRTPRWTALGVAEATVIAGTGFFCLMVMIENLGDRGLDANDWGVLTTIVLVGGIYFLTVRALWRRDRDRHVRAGVDNRTPVEHSSDTTRSNWETP